MRLTITSKKLGKTLKFSRPGNYYLYVNLNGQPGSLGNQICRGGDLVGSTLGYSGDDQLEFERICRRWYRAYVASEAALAACEW